MAHKWSTQCRSHPLSTLSRVNDAKESTGHRRRATDDAIYVELRRGMEVGVLSAGMRIPTERDLAERFNVSRKLVRRALERLTADGLIERKVGSGTFVRGATASPAPGWLLAPPAISPLDAIEARRILEVGAAELIIARARDDDFEAMGVKLRVMETTDDPSAFRAAAFAFNLEVIRAARNPLLTAMYEMLIAARARSGWDKLGYLVNTTDERAQAVRYNREYLDLLRNCDGRRASEQRYRTLSEMITRILSTPER